MTPLWSITANGSDITAACAQRLIRLTVTDEAGITSDKATIALDNRDLAIAAPIKGAKLEISLGYAGEGLTPMGLYVVDEIEVEGVPHSLTISAKAADMRAELKAQKTRGWDGVSLSALVRTIAAEHRLEPVISPDLAGIVLASLAQTNESDLNLLTRVAKTYDAVAKPVSDRLIFVPRGEAKSASGKSMPSVTLGPQDLGRYHATQADRGKYGSVCAQWHNATTGQPESIRVGAGDGPTYTMRYKYPDADQARRAAAAKLDAFARGVGTFSATVVPGRPGIGAESKLTVTGLGDVASGDWVITRATHSLDKASGLTTQIEAETPKGETR